MIVAAALIRATMISWWVFMADSYRGWSAAGLCTIQVSRQRPVKAMVTIGPVGRHHGAKMVKIADSAAAAFGASWTSPRAHSGAPPTAGTPRSTARQRWGMEPRGNRRSGAPPAAAWSCTRRVNGTWYRGANTEAPNPSRLSKPALLASQRSTPALPRQRTRSCGLLGRRARTAFTARWRSPCKRLIARF